MKEKLKIIAVKIIAIRIFYKIIILFFKTYWFIFRPNTRGVKIAVSFDNKILFVRHSYGHKKWTIPGGGVKRDETFEDAAKREIREEVGISMSKIYKIGEFTSRKQYKKDKVECFYAEVLNPEFKIDGMEISEARWSSFEEAPKPHMPIVEQIAKYVKNYEKSKSI